MGWVWATVGIESVDVTSTLSQVCTPGIGPLSSPILSLIKEGGTVESCVVPHLKDGAGFRLPPSQR